jgi:hypothetical protein
MANRREFHRKSGCSDSSCSSEASAWALAAGGVSESPRIFSKPLSTETHAEMILDWNFDTTLIHNFTGGHSVTFVAERVFSLNQGLLTGRDQTVEEVMNVFRSAEKGYNRTVRENNVSYHNAIHGADVLQAFNLLTRKFWTQSAFASYQEKAFMFLGAMFAAALHDLDHLGVSNTFLVATNHPLAKEFNNESVLEKHHVSTALSLMDECMFSLSSVERNEFRRTVTELILATDLSHHNELVSLFSDSACQDTPRRKLCLLLHAADISSCTRPWPIASRWTDRMMEEFFKQGDAERELGFEPITPMMDRISCNIPRVQMGFIDVIARPLFVIVEELSGEESVLLELDRNRAIWQSMDTPTTA